MLPFDYLKRLPQMEVRARLLSEQLMGGRPVSVFKGRGMDFARQLGLRPRPCLR